MRWENLSGDGSRPILDQFARLNTPREIADKFAATRRQA